MLLQKAALNGAGLDGGKKSKNNFMHLLLDLSWAPMPMRYRDLIHTWRNEFEGFVVVRRQRYTVRFGEAAGAQLSFDGRESGHHCRGA